MIKYFLFISGLLLLTVSAFFSVMGMSQLFGSNDIFILAMFVSLEFGKVVSTSHFHLNRKKMNRVTYSYFLCVILILVIFTSMGIYGYLSNSFMKTYNKIDEYLVYDKVLAKRIDMVDLEILDIDKEILYHKKIQGIETDRKLALYTQQNDIVDGKLKISLRYNRDELLLNNKNINDKLDFIKSLNEKKKNIYKMKEEIELKRIDNKLKMTKIDIGPLRFLSMIFNVDIKNVINIIIVFIIFCFDPMGLALLTASLKVKTDKYSISSLSVNADSSKRKVVNIQIPEGDNL